MKKSTDLQNSGNLFHQQTFKNLPEAVIWFNSNGNIEFVNNASTGLYSFSESELKKLSIFDIEPECDETLWNERWDNATKGQNISYNSVHRKKNGINFSVEIHDSVIVENGVEYICSLVWDISVYKEREQKLREALTEIKISEKLLRQSHFTIENLPGAVFWIAKSGAIESANNTACNRLEYSKEKLTGMSFNDICVDFSDSDWANLWKRIKKEKVVITESEHIKKGGEVFPVYIKSNFVEFEGKEYSVSIALDITKRVEAEEQIRLQHQLLKNTINSLTHPFYVIDAESFEIILANDASGSDKSGKKMTCHEISHNSNKPCDGKGHSCPVARIKKTKKARTVEHIHKDANGNDKYVEVHAYPIFDDEGEVSNVIEYSIDITERKKADEALHFALNEVKRLKNQLEAENIYLQQEIKLEHNFEEIISKSKTFKSVLNKVEQVASTDATVLILGETGTGKELLARAVHNISKRRNRPLVKVNCATLPANLIESELFGHEKGAFTGAHTKKTGRFELANGGTIFLDEIGDLPLELQAKLLRVLQEGEFERLGSSQTMKVDARIIAATNVNLEEAIDEGKFRTDLYYRLNVFPIIIPPLRERRDDIPLLVNHFVNKYSKKNSRNVETIPQLTMKALQTYSWPGNIRELENIIERGVIISTSNQLELGDWIPKGKKIRSSFQSLSLSDHEKEYIMEVLEMTNWRVSGDKGAAKVLDIKPTTLEARMKKLGISRNS